MLVKQLELRDGSGGLNNDLHPSKIAANEFSFLENFVTDEGGWPGKKRFGKDLQQYAPIDPSVFVNDVNTLLLLHLDEASGGPFIDSSAPPHNAILPGSPGQGAAATSVAGLLPIGLPLGVRPTKAGVPAGSSDGTALISAGAGTPLNNQPVLVMELWVNIPADFTGEPVTLSRVVGGSPVTFVSSNNGVTLLGNQVVTFTDVAPPGESFPRADVKNGFQLFRDWSTVTNSNASDPYVTFRVRTKGIPGTSTVTTSRYLPTGVWLHLRGVYDSATGIVSLYVNGELQAQVVALGGGLIDSASASDVRIGGDDTPALYDPFLFYSIKRTFNGIIDECRISNTLRSTFPFKEPRGKPWPLERSDGGRQLIVTAGDGLWYTVGDGAWTNIITGQSTTAFWDAVQVGDSLYLQNGVNNPIVWNGTTVHPWGEGVTALSLATLAGGTIAGGTYRYVYTFLFGSEETGPSPLASITFVNPPKYVEITNIPLGPEGCTGRRIYRSENGGTIYFLDRQISNNTTTSLTGPYVAGAPSTPLTDTGADGATDAKLGTGLFVQMSAEVAFTAMPKARYLLGNHNRVLFGGMPNDQYGVRWSEANVPAVVKLESVGRARTDKGEIRGLAAYYGETHVSKGGNATLVMRGDNPANWLVLETLHPTIGAIDHWSYVHRTLPGRDSYVLCFWAEDGAYAYAGHDFFKISENINGTVMGLAQSKASRFEVTATTEEQFEAAPASGQAASVNVYQPVYDTDGLREFPGQVRVVDQLDYIGIPLPTPVAGQLTLFIAKGPAEGEFFFSVATDNILYRTTDNFVTATAVGVTPLNIADRIISIVRKGATEEYLCITAGFSAAGGSVYQWNQTTTTWTTIYAGAGTLFWNADTHFRFISQFLVPNSLSNVNDGEDSGQSSGFPSSTKTFAALGNASGASNSNSVNIYLTHAQKVFCRLTLPTGSAFGFPFDNAAAALSASSLTGLSGVTPTERPIFHNTFTASALAAGFWAFRDDGFVVRYIANSSLRVFKYGESAGISIQAAHRENARYLGGPTGTFAPQAFWDAGTSKLFFAAASAPDANGLAYTTFYSLTAAGPAVPVLVYGPVPSNMAIAPDGLGNAYLIDSQPSAGNGGFDSGLRKIVLATSVATTLGTGINRRLFTRLAYNPNTGNLLGIGKLFGISYSDMQNFKGFISSFNGVTGAYVELLQTAITPGSGTNGIPEEIAVSNVTPFDFYVSMSTSVLDPVSLYRIDKTYTDIFAAKSGHYDGATATRANLLFVPQSGLVGGQLWADRLYMVPVTSPARIVQLGVRGDWRVVGTYQSVIYATGGFTAFDDFQSDFQGAVGFELRNPTTYVAVTPNTKIVGFPAPAANFQWRATLTWDYTSAVSPLIEFVTIGYFLGSPDIPRVVGFHWRSRTYWAVANAGQTRNHLVMVYQKNNSWTMYTGWRLKGMNEFRNEFVALEDYQLVRLESGQKDMGSLIRTIARTGYMMDDLQDKCVRDLNAVIQTWVNDIDPAAAGYMKMRAYSGSVALPAEWIFPIASTATNGEEPRQVKGTPKALPFAFSYTRALALEIGTSDETTGPYVPVVAQKENIAGLTVKLLVSRPRYLIASP